jgi:hypothetical protein
MNIDRILSILNAAEVDYILIGGVNFLLRHGGPMTYDVDVWVSDNDQNLERVAMALKNLGAEWGSTDATWGPVKSGISWLKSQNVFCLTTREGGLDIFREVRGLEGKYSECKNRAIDFYTSSGVPYRGLSDSDMLQTQLVLEPAEQKPERISRLKKAMES